MNLKIQIYRVWFCIWRGQRKQYIRYTVESQSDDYDYRTLIWCTRQLMQQLLNLFLNQQFQKDLDSFLLVYVQHLSQQFNLQEYKYQK
ncbi:unnamed protein product [Paramecium sonneborni]|uniref:Uncharacterized protein n=1 Tax=Paramecium sonneborni TaxID=65129 RepID=A0A8S1RDK6_9CILI|nr:unnamed protein product [Paramecium sonneborni]CAD8126351.1 unnamed protein product [Paramecium sonneborni]